MDSFFTMLFLTLAACSPHVWSYPTEKLGPGNLLGTLEGQIHQLRQEVATRDQEISMLVLALAD